MAFLARMLIFIFVFSTSGVLPAFAWAQPADPCMASEVPGDHDDAEDCRLACQCPCCPVRVSFTPLEMAPEMAPAQSVVFAPPATPLLAGVKSEIFHPPSR